MDFSASYPSYARTRALDEVRTREYPLLNEQRHVYLDYTAANLPPRSLMARHLDLLRGQVLGNPHSTNPASSLTMELVERTRRAVLAFFNASADDWVVIFTANATQALKLVGESYPFEPGGEYLLTFDNHNSVNGIREFARTKRSTTTYVPIVLPEMRVDDDKLMRHLERARPGGANLFAYPAQSNFSGVQHPLDWIEIALVSASTARVPVRFACPWDLPVTSPTSTPSSRSRPNSLAGDRQICRKYHVSSTAHSNVGPNL